VIYLHMRLLVWIYSFPCLGPLIFLTCHCTLNIYIHSFTQMYIFRLKFALDELNKVKRTFETFITLITQNTHIYI